MLFLPEQFDILPSGYTEIEAYIAMADLRFPFYKSVIVGKTEVFTAGMIQRIESYLGETFIKLLDMNGNMLRPKPMRISGLEKLFFDNYPIECETLWIESSPYITEAEYYLVIEHTGDESCAFVWGKGFYPQNPECTCIPPHQKIQLLKDGEFIHSIALPIEIISSAEYRKSREKYLEKINNSGIITNRYYRPMSLYLLQQLALYARVLDANLYGLNYKVKGAVYGKRIVFDRLYYK